MESRQLCRELEARVSLLKKPKGGGLHVQLLACRVTDQE